MTRLLFRGTVAAVLGVAWGALAAEAQDDFRHLDRGRPLRVEDAYPIKLNEWEWEAGGALARRSDETAGAIVLELKTGLFRNAQLGVEAHGAIEREEGVSASGIEEVGFHLLYNLNQEGRRSPAIAFRGDVAVPGSGAVAAPATTGRAAAMLTRTLGPARLHLNGAHRWSPTEEGGNTWEFGAALDRVLGLSSRMMAADILVEVPDMGPNRVWVDIGARVQLTKQTVFDAGLYSRVDQWGDGTPEVGLTVGVSRSFGVRRLVPVGPYPSPRLR